MSENNPVNFPENIDIEKDDFVNRSREISVDDIWICSPRFPEESQITRPDHSSEVDITDAAEPSFSALKPVSDRPDFDYAVWFDLTAIPGALRF